MITVPIAIGIILRDEQVLIAQRKQEAHLGGYWEFPGGKLEPGESSEQAMCREVLEEVNVRVQSYQPFMSFEHEYPERTVSITAWLVTEFSGEPNGREGQVCRWLPLSELGTINFPAGNRALIERLTTLTLAQGV